MGVAHMNPLRKLRVLFVCVGNSCRSQMAEAFARAYGTDVLEAESAGLQPARRVSRRTRAVLRERGVPTTGQFAKALDEVHLGRFDLVVNLTVFELPDGVKLPVRDWPVGDPSRKQITVYQQTADKIEHMVQELIEELRWLRGNWAVPNVQPVLLAPPRPLYALRQRAASCPQM